MGATAAIPTQVITVEPGQEASCPVVITNNGTVVDQFTITVAGDAASWTAVEPQAVNLMPGQSATVMLRFRPPRSADVASSEVPFAVHVSSVEDPAGSVAEEGTVEVAPFTEVTIALAPPSAEGSTRARYEVVVDNAGNHPVDVELNAAGREDGLTFRLDRARFFLEPGTAAFIPLRVRPRRRFLRGQPRRHSFQVAASLGRGEALVADGTMVQRQLLARWLMPALIALLVVAGALLALWLGVLRPAVKSAARSAAAEQAAEVKSSAQGASLQAAEAKQEAAQAKQEAGQAKGEADRALGALGLDPSGVKLPPPTPAPQPIDFRIQATTPIGTNPANFRQFTHPDIDPARTLLITDIVLQNPRGNRGTIQILRDSNGDQTVLLEVGLNNFRDLDQHWVQPWRFQPGETVVVAVSCQNLPADGECTPAVSFSGRLEG